MSFAESIMLALQGLWANKMRSGLTMLGMIIGVSAVIALMSVGKGAEASITSRIQGMGTNLLFVRPGASTQGGVQAAAGTRPTLTYEDSLAIAEECTTCSLVAPEMNSRAQVTAGPTNLNTQIIGTTPEYAEVRNFQVQDGEFIGQQQLDARSTVAVLGGNVAANLFSGQSAVGESIRINQVNFRVIGVMESKGTQGMGNQDDMILLPLTTLQQRLTQQRTVQGGLSVGSINVQLADGKPETKAQAVEEIGNLLRERHKVFQDDFTIGSQDDLLATASEVTGIMTILLGSIAGISLIVGGIGIMNIMLVTVTERTREIGIRKAVGAKRRDIMSQFLIESGVVSIVGGAAGILLGLGFSQVLSRVSLGDQSLNAVVTPDAIMLAAGVSAAIGIFFGIYPASRAARLNPIEALRYE